MAKKKFKINLKFAMDAPVTLTFALISLILYLLDSLAFKGSLAQKILLSPTCQTGSLPFVVSQPVSFFRLILYAFSAVNWTALLANLLFVLLLGPAMEERYGSLVIGIMMGVSILFSGVLNAAFCPQSLKGCTSLVFMMIFLNSFMSFSKKKIPLSFIMIFALYIAYGILDKSTGNLLGTIVCVAGGLCGSLFAFLTSPKVKAEKKSGLLNKAEKAAYLEELDSQSPRNASKKSKSDDDDNSTVVGTLKF